LASTSRWNARHFSARPRPSGPYHRWRQERAGSAPSDGRGLAFVFRRQSRQADQSHSSLSKDSQPLASRSAQKVLNDTAHRGRLHDHESPLYTGDRPTLDGHSALLAVATRRCRDPDIPGAAKAGGGDRHGAAGNCRQAGRVAIAVTPRNVSVTISRSSRRARPTVKEINEAMRTRAQRTADEGIRGYTTAPTVSIRLQHDRFLNPSKDQQQRCRTARWCGGSVPSLSCTSLDVVARPEWASQSRMAETDVAMGKRA